VSDLVNKASLFSSQVCVIITYASLHLFT